MTFVIHHIWMREELMAQRWNSNWTLLLLLLLTNVIVSSSAQDPPPPPSGDACASRNCFHGTCKDSKVSSDGFTCDCFPGWKKLFDSPYCIVPNCTIDWSCDAAPDAPPPPPPPPPFPSLPQLGCLIDLCGPNGQCIPNGTDHVCKCNIGSDNLLGAPTLPCMKKCNEGFDCHNVTLGPPLQPPPPPPTSLAPPSIGALSPTKSSSGSRNCKSLSTVLLAAIALILI